MKNENLCEYLSDIGILLFENMDSFFQIYSSNNSKKFNTEIDKLKSSLFIYLQNTIKNENLLNIMSSNIIDAYYNTQTVNQYKTISNLINVLRQKLFSHFNFFLTRTSMYIMKNAKGISSEPVNKEIRRNDNEQVQKEENIEKENKGDRKDEKLNINKKKKKKTNKTRRMNKYKNNWYRNINDYGVIQHGFFVNNNDNLDKYNDIDKYNINYNDIDNFEDDSNYLNNNYNEYDEEIDFPNVYNSPVVSKNFKSLDSPINYYIPKYKNENNIINNNYNQNMYDINIPMQQYIRNINTNANRKPEEYLADYDFFENQEKHEQKVKNKILNMQNEKLINMEKECTFNPKINSPKSYRPIPNYNFDNKFEKLYNDSIMNKIKKEQQIKKHFEEFKFTPDLQKTENYLVFTTFQERLQKSINMKEKRKNENNNVKENKNSNKKNEKKKSVIDWDKIIKENKEKNKNENYYGNNILKKKKNLENLSSKIETSINSNNIIIKESSNIKQDDNYKEEEKEKKSDDENKIIELENEKDEKKKEDDIKDQNSVNDKYKSASIKNLLNNNNLLKKEF